MTDYEITYITRDDTDPGVAATIQGADGRIKSERTIGRKSFAYPIGKETAGQYTVLRFQLEPSRLASLDQQLRLGAQLIRHLIVEVPLPRLTPDMLEVKGLREARELEPAETGLRAGAPTAPAAVPAATQDMERDKKLQEQLDKLLGGEPSIE